MKKSEIVNACRAALNCYDQQKWYKELEWKGEINHEQVYPLTENWSAGNMHGYFGYPQGGAVVHVVITGSDDPVDWAYNMNMNAKSVTPYVGVNTAIKVHEGFLALYLMCRERIFDKVKAFDQVVIIGHSMGASVATLCAVDMEYRCPGKKITCFPISSPRVGNNAFCASYNRRVPDTLRVWLGDDIVVRVPPSIWPVFEYGHVGEACHLSVSRSPWRPSTWVAGAFGTPDDHWPHKVLQAAISQL